MAISVVVPIKNEARNLPRCLASVVCADEIFVVDSYRTDDSAVIAQLNGAQTVQFEFNGTWPKKKNWALERARIAVAWNLILRRPASVSRYRQPRLRSGGTSAVAAKITIDEMHLSARALLFCLM